MLQIKYSHEKEKEILETIRKVYKGDPEGLKRINERSRGVEDNPASTKSVDIEEINRKWEERYPEFKESLAKFYEKDISEIPDIPATAYLSRAPNYPYNWQEKWFAIPIDQPIDFTIQVIAHELSHFVMFALFEDRIYKEFGGKMFDNVKEVSTTLLEKTYWKDWIAKEPNFHKRNKEFGEYILQNLIKPDNPTYKEIHELTKRYQTEKS